MSGEQGLGSERSNAEEGPVTETQGSGHRERKTVWSHSGLQWGPIPVWDV